MLCCACLRFRVRGARSGLTLVEVTLAAAMAAILAAIILPLLARGRELGYQAKCAQNLRNLASAFHLYYQDWNGYWPSPGGLVGDRGYWSQSGGGGLFPYVRQCGLDSVWCCPRLTEWHGQFPPRSYCMNSYLRTPADVEFSDCIKFLCGINVSAIAEPRGTILLYEGVPRTREFEDVAYTEDKITYIYRCANWTWVRGYYGGYKHTIGPGQPWHGRKNNYLYCDGHIVCRPPGRPISPQHLPLSTYREMREWYVDKKSYEHVFTTTWSRWVPRDAE